MAKKIGIDIGTVCMRLVVLDEKNKFLQHWEKPVNGNSKGALAEMLQNVGALYPDETIFAGITGNGKAIVSGGSKLEELPALQAGVHYLAREAGSVLSVGAMSACCFTENDQNGPHFAIAEGCAGGTGLFLEQQARALGMELRDYILAIEAKRVPAISGHCAVFAKTDLIHRRQEGFLGPELLKGVCVAMAKNLRSTLIKGSLPVPVVLCGGAFRNPCFLKALQEVMKWKADDIIREEKLDYAQALGAALLAEEKLLCTKEWMAASLNPKTDKAISDPLPPPGFIPPHPQLAAAMPGEYCTLGIDVGSTSVNLVLMNAARKIVNYRYLRTGADAWETVQKGMGELLGSYENQICLREIGVTGSGRIRIGKMLHAGTVRDEITCQARAAVFANPEADTVFEIGGQDSKYMQIKGQGAADFRMNRICSAGTGSFLEEQACWGSSWINSVHSLFLQRRRRRLENAVRCLLNAAFLINCYKIYQERIFWQVCADLSLKIIWTKS